MTTEVIISLILAGVTTGCAVLALWQSAQQQKIHNQHQLWDKRMAQYNVLHSLMQTYQENRHLFWMQDKPNKDIAEVPETVYYFLLNCQTLRHINDSFKMVEHQHATIVKDYLLNNAKQMSVLWEPDISEPAVQFVQLFANFTELLHRQVLLAKDEPTLGKLIITTEAWQTRVQERAKSAGLFDSLQNLQVAYDKCIQNNILECMKNTLTFSKPSRVIGIKTWRKSKQPQKPQELQQHTETSIKQKQDLIDIHDKRLSQLFKVCYIAAPGFASALLANATLINNPDTVVKYTIPAIITATAAVVLWIIKHALRAGQCYAYSEKSWEDTIEHSNRTYQYALAMIKCALTWIIVVFLVSVISPQYERLTSFIQWLSDTFTPTINLCILSGIIILRCVINRSTSNAKIQSICTQITYYAGLLWTTQVIWNL